MSEKLKAMTLTACDPPAYPPTAKVPWTAAEKALFAQKVCHDVLTTTPAECAALTEKMQVYDATTVVNVLSHVRRDVTPIVGMVWAWLVVSATDIGGTLAAQVQRSWVSRWLHIACKYVPCECPRDDKAMAALVACFVKVLRTDYMPEYLLMQMANASSRKRKEPAAALAAALKAKGCNLCT